LGPVTGKRKPARALRSVAAGERALVGILDGRTLLRSTDAGATFSPVLTVDDGALVEVAMLRTGEGLALAAPERLLVTTDDAATFRPIASPGIGARRLVADVDGGLLMEGLQASALLRTSGAAHFEIDRRVPKRRFVLKPTGAPDPLRYGDALSSRLGALV